MKIGLIGDTHIPNRAREIPKDFLDFFIKENVDLIIHLGDLNDFSVLEELESIADVKAVKGNTDYLDFPKELMFSLNNYKFFVFHSDVIYPRGNIEKMYNYVLSKNIKPDFVIFGHVHYPVFRYYKGIFFISPGTATGVRSGEIINTIKSVAVLDLGNLKIKFKWKK
jgi:putative phosphoesterase